MGYLYPTIAIIAEVIATNAPKASNEFENWSPGLLVIAGYSIAFYYLSLVLKTIPSFIEIIIVALTRLRIFFRG